jgi:hypothetical protein
MSGVRRMTGGIASGGSWFGALCLLVSFCSAAQAAKRIALVIGNDAYTNMPAAQQLQKAVNDARTVGAALTSLGFEVTLGTNLGRQGMVDRLADFTARLAPGDTAAFFFAGHGVAIGGVNYLVPSDVPPVNEGAEARVRGASLAEPDIIAEIQARSVNVALLVIDACRDNPFPRNAGRSIGSSRGLADAKPARGIFTIYSAGIGQTALDRLTDKDPELNSVFTRIFAEELVKPGLHLGDLAVETRERVAALALRATDRAGNPAPHEQTPAYYDQTLGGRIYLAGNATSASKPAEAPKLAAAVPQTPRVDVAALAPKQVEAERAAAAPRPGAVGEVCARNGAETYCVSSALKGQFGNQYGPANLFSGPQGVAWVEGRAGQGVGEWITIEFDGMRMVRTITLRNGYQKDDDIYRKNGRVRRLLLQTSQGASIPLTLQDRSGVQIVNLDTPVQARWLKFTIDDVYPGSRYTDTALSKLTVGAERLP